MDGNEDRNYWQDQPSRDNSLDEEQLDVMERQIQNQLGITDKMLINDELKELNKKITKYFALKSPEDKILKKKRRRFLNRGYAARVRANQDQNLNDLIENVRRLEEEIAGEARRFQEMKAMMEELAEQAGEVEKLEQLETLVERSKFLDHQFKITKLAEAMGSDD